MRFYPPKKDSFNLATGLPAKRLVWLKGAGQARRTQLRKDKVRVGSGKVIPTLFIYKNKNPAEAGSRSFGTKQTIGSLARLGH